MFKHALSPRLLAAATLLFSLTAYAQLAPAPGLNFKLGDDLRTVKNALHTDMDPETADAPNQFMGYAVKPVLHLRTKGITVTFNKKEIVESIRLDENFSGSVMKIKLGDTEKTVKSVLGKPVKPAAQNGTVWTYTYAIDDAAYLKIDLSEANGVTAMTVMR